MQNGQKTERAANRAHHRQSCQCLANLGLVLVGVMIVAAAFVLVMGTINVALAAASGPNGPTAASGTNWASATNVFTSDDVRTTYSGTSQDNLAVTGFGFSVPVGATIDGIILEVEGFSSGATAAGRQYQVALTKDGAAAAGSVKTGQQFDTTEGFVTSGGATDLWGTTWTPAEINAGTFGILLADNDTTADGTFSVDFARITIVYSISGWSDSPMLHNSNRFAGTSKWGGDWGTDTGQFGGFTCGTCHGKNTGNIKRVKATIDVPNGTDTWPNGTTSTNVTFTTTDEAANPVATGFGDDSDGHTSSVRVCETCHSQNKYHNYDTTVPAQTATDHYNNADCIQCHQHKNGFMASCAACHNANNTLADSHPAHYQSATEVTGNFIANDSTSTQYIFQCGNCHDESGTVTHNNGDANPDVQAAEVDLAGTGTYTPDTVKAGDDVGSAGTFEYTAGTCGTNDCHNDGTAAKGAPNATATWTSTLAADCTGCHDNNAAAAQTMATNAHGAHVNDGTIMSDVACNTCHTVTVDGTDRAIADKSVHADGTRNVDIIASVDSNGTPGDNFAANACNNVYCHSDGKASPTYQSIDWGTTITDCVSCHDGAVAGTSLSGAHAAHFNGATLQTIGSALGCADCHSAAASSNTTIATPANHVNQSVENIDCSTNICHSDGNIGNVTYNAPTFATDTYDCTTCHGNGVDQSYPSYVDGGAGTVDSNSHNAHVGTSLISCEECHSDTSTAGTLIDGAAPAQHVDGGIDVVFKQGGTYDDTANNDTCSTTYCHGAGTPQWGAAALNCNDCHNANSALADSHGVHYNTATVATAINTNNDTTATKYVFQCGNCHNGTTHAGGEVNAGVQAAEVSLAGGGTYTADSVSAGVDAGFSFTAGTCSTNDCHNDGTAAQGAPNYNAAALQWSVTTLPADCTGCHDNNAAAAQTMATNAHGAHVNDGTIMSNASCNSCHGVTVDGTDRAIADKSIHVDGTRNVDIIAGLDGGNTWAANSCDAVYCHSDGKATPNYVTVDWTTTISTCTACHDGAGTTTTLSASHLAHIGTDATDTNKQFGYTCDDCHVATASNNTTISTAANHVNQSRDVAVAVANGGTGTIGGDFAGGTCATTQCHGSTTPDWTAGATTGDCSACHGMAADPTDGRDTNGDTVATDAQVGAHVAHLNPTITDAIGCDECHLTTVTSQAAATTYVDKVNATGHIDSALPAELVWGNLADGGDDGQAGVSPTNDQAGCATTYCHDGAAIKNGWDGGTLAPTWTDTNFIQGTAADCDNCHGYPPGGGHVADADCSKCHNGVNADDVTFTAGGLTAHLDGVVQSSADDCTTCHAADIDGALAGVHGSHTDVATFLSGKTVSGGDYGGAGWYTTTWSSGKPNFGCGECHPAGEGTSHPINGLNVDLDPAGESPTAGSPKLLNTDTPTTPTYSSRTSVTCSNIYCHSDAQATPTYATTPDWYGGTVSGQCNDCHGNAPGSGTHANHLVGIHYQTLYDGASGLMADSGTAGSGAAHGDAATADTIGCQSCHNNTVTVEFNDQNSVCSSCHDGGTAPLQGNMVIDTTGSTHVNTVPDVVFDDFSAFKSRAQIRDDITTVTELNNNWTRTNGYKAVSSFDQGKVATPSYAGGTCSNVSCHNGITTPTWNTGFVGDCRACHTDLP